MIGNDLDNHTATVKAAAKAVAHKYNVDAEDVEQDIWEELLKRDGYANRSGIYTIAHCIAIDTTRGRPSHGSAKDIPADLSETTPEDEVSETDLGPWLSETTSGGITNPERDVLWQETVEEIEAMVVDIVNRATQRQQEVLRAYYLLGMDYLETAETLGLTIQAVDSRMRAARATLGRLELTLRAWREYAYPESREPDRKPNRGHSGALLRILRG